MTVKIFGLDVLLIPHMMFPSLRRGVMEDSPFGANLPLFNTLQLLFLPPTVIPNNLEGPQYATPQRQFIARTDGGNQTLYKGGTAVTNVPILD